MKKFLKIESIILILIVTLILGTNITYAFDPTQISQPHIETGIAYTVGGVVSVVQIIGTAVAVGASIYLGIRYILSSVEEKADIKKKLIPFIAGVVIFYGATGILQLISAVAGWFPTR